MGIYSIILIAISLAIDAFVVAATSSACIKNLKIKHFFIFSTFFGFFQFFMPILGYYLGNTFSNYIEKYDHWVVFLLLAFIGGKMFFETFSQDNSHVCKTEKEILSFTNILALSIVTSIDALSTGISFLVTKTDIMLASSIIGIITFFLSGIGIIFGKKISNIFKDNVERFCGAILFLIGLKFLLEHLFNL